VRAGSLARGIGETVTVPNTIQEARQMLVDVIGWMDNQVDPIPPGPGEPFYLSRSDRDPAPPPVPPPSVGPAGYAFRDPTFGSRMWRASDERTAGGSALRVPSNSHLAAWNADGSIFLTMNEGGGAVFFSFDGEHVAHLTAEIASQIEPAFSYVDPFAIYGTSVHNVKRWNLDTGSVETVQNLDELVPGLASNTYVGGILTSDDDVWIVFFGGTGQDSHHYVYHSTGGLLDTNTIEGFPPFPLHSLSIDRSNRYVFLYPAGPNAAAVGSVLVWDVIDQTFTPINTLYHGHDSLGYGISINQDCCTGATEWDAAQWQIRTIADPTKTANLIPDVLRPKVMYLSEHSNWRAATPDAQMPLVSSTYRYAVEDNGPVGPRAWDDEIIAIAVDGSGLVNRFCHHQSRWTPENSFWNQPIHNVSPDGRFAIVTSNWGHTLGTHNGQKRQDVFLVELL
jgi:hypothetical protein